MSNINNPLLKMNCLAALLSLILAVEFVSASDINSRGIAEPPFLSYGVNSNLLLLLDNSGSMLDMAYVDEESNCNDSPDEGRDYIGYNPDNPYAGYFEEDNWYTWNQGIPLWAPNSTYDHFALVYDNGILYQAECAEKVDGSVPDTCESEPASTAREITDDDTNIIWTAKPGVREWKSGQSYSQGDFCRYGAQLYYALAAVSGAGNPLTDTMHWEPVEHTWRADTAYSAHDVVSFQGMVFVLNDSKSLAARSSQSIWEDDDSGFPWTRINEGSFAVVTDGTQCVGTDYATSSNDLCIKVDETATPKGVLKFSAKGKVLNWLAASRFDIQKKILTGGKYRPETQMLIAENRGCAGSGFIKGITVVQGNVSRILSFRIGGPEKDNTLEGRNDWVDTLDNTTRIEVLGITDGPLLSGDCQDAIDGMLSGANLQSLSNDINGCLTPQRVAEDEALGDQRPFLNHALQACQKFLDGTDRNLNTIIGECEKLYEGKSSSKQSYYPWDINPYYGAYACYGVYDANVNHQARTGFIGRCWDAGGGAVGCNLKGAESPIPPLVCSGCSVPAGTWLSGGNLRRNNNGHVEECADTVYKNNTKTYSCKKVDDWTPVYFLAGPPITEYVGDPTCGIGTVTADWNPLNQIASVPCDDPEDPICGGPEYCVYQGMYDYCKSLSIPEAIDPSDQASTTTDLWNAPATLIDSGVIAATGTDRPLAVMKGYIQQQTKPSGILQSTAGDLRIGAMAFNDNGAGSDSECGGTDVPPQIEQFCSTSKKDGALVISEIKLGSTITDTNGTTVTSDDRTHVDDLTEAINDVRATSWTPLAEAMYNAIGYYTQNTLMRLNPGDFFVDGESDADGNDKHNPVTDWCQPNNILIITEGASTADINLQVKTFVEGLTIVSDGDTEIGNCSDGLDGSTYLDDLTNHAFHATASQLYPTGKGQIETPEGDMEDKQNITTYIVATDGMGELTPDDNECSPAKLIEDAARNGGTEYYDSNSPKQLEEDLLKIFNSLRQRASAGSAASVVSSSRGGEGAVYQAIFWPELTRNDAAGIKQVVNWAGDVRALFIDSNGYLFDDSAPPFNQLYTEDTNGDGTLVDSEDVNHNGVLDGDRRVIVYYDADAGRSKACYNTSIYSSGVCDNGDDLDDVAFLWRASDWLNSLSESDLANNRHPVTIMRADDITSGENKRQIYTWDDLNNNGSVDAGEWIDFVAAPNFPDGWKTLNSNVSGGRSSIYTDFDVSRGSEDENLAKIKDIINWVRGKSIDAYDIDANSLTPDEPALRSRLIPDSEGAATNSTWRLGDVIYSTPMAVTSPAEAYNLLYNDYSYAEFLSHWKRRRHVIYFGSNDGMLHAVNGGFYIEDEKKFCLT